MLSPIEGDIFLYKILLLVCFRYFVLVTLLAVTKMCMLSGLASIAYLQPRGTRGTGCQALIVSFGFFLISNDEHFWPCISYTQHKHSWENV